jgi:aminocarboxymuconate-semialdehyde decarboxylase
VADRDVARKLIAAQNEELAEVCAAMPDRFVAFATVALPHPDLAVEQLVEGIKRCGLRGSRPAGASRGGAGRPPARPTAGESWSRGRAPRSAINGPCAT